MVFPIQGGQVSGQVGGQAGGQTEQMTERQQEVLELIKSNPAISRKQLSERLAISFMRMHYNLSKRQFTVIISQSDLKLLFGFLKGLPIIRQGQLILGLF